MSSKAGTKYSKELVDKICDLMSGSHKSIRVCCAECGITYNTFKNWVNEESEQYQEYAFTQYTRAKEEQLQFMSEEITNLTYDMQKLIREGKTYTGENVNAAVAALRVQIDSLKWLLSKLAPKKYGDKVEHTGNLDVAITGMKIV